MGGPAPIISYTCETCHKSFKQRKRYDRVVRFCGRKCFGKSQLGKPGANLGIPMKASTKRKLRATFFKKEQKAWNEGVPMTKSLREKVKYTFFKKGNQMALGKGVPKGERNPRWKGGRQTTHQGYIHILRPSHPLTNIRGYVPEQILVSEQYLGRHLTKGEVVHHINQVKTDNRPENLYVFPSKVEHARHHQNLLLGKEQRKLSNL